MRALVTTSWDDGHPLDLKLADELARRGIAGTFYVAPQNRERPVMGHGEIRDLAERFEIGAHSLTHPDLRRLSGEALRRELQEGKDELEDILGRQIGMFCYPKGRYNARVRRAVVECGFAGARTTRTFRLGLPRDPWLMPTAMPVRRSGTWAWVAHCARSHSLTGLRIVLGKGRGRPWHELAELLFRHVRHHGGIWHLWGHSWEAEERGMWDELRGLLDAVAGHQDVACVTNGEVARLTRQTSD